MPKSGENLFTIKGKVWRYPGPAGWYFVNMNRQDSARIRKMPRVKTVAWGYVRAEAAVGKTVWNTTLFPAKGGIYMIAIKAAVADRMVLYFRFISWRAFVLTGLV